MRSSVNVLQISRTNLKYTNGSKYNELKISAQCLPYVNGLNQTNHYMERLLEELDIFEILNPLHYRLHDMVFYNDNRNRSLDIK